MKKIIFPLLTSACLFLFHFSLAADEPRPENSKVRSQLDAMQGKPAPKLGLKGWINSKPLSLEDLKGKIVVLDFWATWCGPCIGAIPHTHDMMEKYADEGVVFIGVCAKSGSEKMAATVQEHGIKYPVAVDAGANAAFHANSFPDYYLIDRSGVLRWADIANSDVEKAIGILLKEKAKKKK